MSDNVPDNLKMAIEHLIQVGMAEGIVVAGFAFHKEGHFIINFGNCSDHGDLRLFEELCRMKDESIADGNFVSLPVHKVN